MAKASRGERDPAAALPGDIALMNVTAIVFAAVGLIALVATLLLWFARQPAFAVRAIRIEGDVMRNSVSTIRANALPHLEGNFFTLDIAATRRGFEAVPWVRRAVVDRVWPNRLRVRLEEHRPVALWSHEGASERLVNSHGEVFEANVGDVEDDALPTLAGPEGSSAHVLAMLARVEAGLAPLGARVEGLALSGRGSWQATLDTGAVVELGRGSDDVVLARAAQQAGSVKTLFGRAKDWFLGNF